MEIHARVALSLSNTFYKIELKYDTFEKATYDSYIIASLVKNAKNEKAAMKYIDEITGKGSLNPHFRKLYEQISAMTESQVDGILTDSLYPKTVIDTSHHFKYYKMFDATRMDGRVYSGDLSKREHLENLVMTKGDGVKFLDISCDGEPGTLKSDMYNAIFSDEGIKVELDDGVYLPISKDDFHEAFGEGTNFESEWMPTIGNEITAGNWAVLTEAVVNAWGASPLTYKNKDGDLVELTSDFLKVTKVISAFDILFYRELRRDFKRENAEYVEEAIDFLESSGNINTFKTKSLLSMLSVVDEVKSQKIVQWFLGRKNSKDVAEFGLKLIKNGLEKGWDKNSLIAIKQVATPDCYPMLYKLDSDLGFTINDILAIPDDDLTKEHLEQKQAHLRERDAMLGSIRQWIGEMSEVRERAKKLQKNEVVKSFNDFANKYIGHNRKDFRNMQFEQLKKEFDYIGRMYRGNYQKVRAALEKSE